MNRPPAILWLILLLLLLPTAAGRILLDVVGGVALVLVAVPLLLTGLGFIGWKLLQMQATTAAPHRVQAQRLEHIRMPRCRRARPRSM